MDSSSTCVQHYGRRRSKHGTTQEQSPQERTYHCSQTKSVITKHAHGAAQRAQEYHGHEQVQHNTPDGHNHQAQGNSDPASDSPLPCCQPSGRPCLPVSTARRDTGRDQEGEERQAMRGSTGTEPSQHKQTAWGQVGTCTGDQPHADTRTQHSTVRQAQETQQGERCHINSHKRGVPICSACPSITTFVRSFRESSA